MSLSPPSAGLGKACSCRDVREHVAVLWGSSSEAWGLLALYLFDCLPGSGLLEDNLGLSHLCLPEFSPTWVWTRCSTAVRLGE